VFGGGPVNRGVRLLVSNRGLRMKVARERILIFALLACLTLSCARPDSSSITTDNASTPAVIRKGDLLVKQGGWPLPDVTKCKNKGERSRSKFPWKETKARKDLFFTLYTDCEFDVPLMNKDGKADPIRKVRIYNIRVYDIQGREFCYTFQYNHVSLPGETLAPFRYKVAYYDLDGDGKFESWDTMHEITKPPIMPEWDK
jgi:hypothetical protein